MLIRLLLGIPYISGWTWFRISHTVSHIPWSYPIEWFTTLIALGALLIVPLRRRRGAPMLRVRRFAAHRFRACALIFVLSVGGRLALLFLEPFPEPAIQDEFSYLLQADTFAHGRLANPVLPFPRHFEQFHVLMEPTFASMYAPASALFLAAGEVLFHSPRPGLLVEAALAAASLCWMLQAWLPPEWALLGGCIAVVRISWFSYFGNSYWGGAAGMLGGCLLLGAAGRLLRSSRPRATDGIAMAVGLFLLANSRPYEGLVISLPVCLWTLWRLAGSRRLKRAVLLPALAALGIGATWTAWYCYTVTGRLTLPQALQRSQWATAPSLLIQKPDFSHTYQFADQDGLYKDYEFSQTYARENSLRGYIASLPEKFFREWLYFISPSLTLAFVAGIFPTLRSRRQRLPMWVLLYLCLALAAETWVQPHYVAIAVGVLYLFVLNGMRWLRAGARRWDSAWRLAGPKLFRGTLWAVGLALMVRLFVVPLNQWPPSWSSWPHAIPGYGAINARLRNRPGKQLVIVRYGSGHFWGDSWVNNGADLASQKVIWARDTEPDEPNDPLICAFPDREVLLLQPPDQGYVAMPDATLHQEFDVSGFLTPYPGRLTCVKRERNSVLSQHVTIQGAMTRNLPRLVVAG